MRTWGSGGILTGSETGAVQHDILRTVIDSAGRYFGSSCVEVAVVSQERVSVSTVTGSETRIFVMEFEARVMHKLNTPVYGPPKCMTCDGVFDHGFVPAPWIKL